MRAAGVLPPVADTWSHLATAAAAWSGRHQRLVRRLTRVRAVLLWVALVVAVVVLLRVPAARDSAATYGTLLWLLPVWYLLARTKTLPWRAVIVFFSLCVPWSATIGWICHRISVAWTEQRLPGGFVIEGDASAAGSVIAVAAVAEECLKLLPVVALAVVAARRVWRLAGTDWLLLGFASGLAFQATEEVLRRLVARDAQPGLTDILTGDGRGPGSGYAQYGPSPLSGWSSLPDGTVFPGHHVTTGLLAAAVGLAVAAGDDS